MSLIEQLSDERTRAFAQHCIEKKSTEELREMTNIAGDESEMKHWEISQGQWEEAVAAALADQEAQEGEP